MTPLRMFSTTEPAESLRPWHVWALFAVLVLATTRLFASTALSGDLFGAWSPLLYQAATLGFNYFDFGPVRRGLGGTIVHLLSDDILVGTVRFHLLSAAAVAASACLFLRRLEAPPVTQAIYAFVMLAMMLRWGEDAGRIDMAIAALLGFAAFALAAGRLFVACALVCVGLFVHETSFIFGIPLLAALVWQRGLSSFGPREKWGAAALFAVTLAAYGAVTSLPGLPPHVVAEAVRSKFPGPSVLVDWAIYFALSGGRGVRTSLCQNATDPSYWVHPASGLVVLAVATLALVRQPRSQWAAVALAALPPFAFLSVIANDTARWTMLGSFNIWLVLVSFPRDGAFRVPGAVAAAAAVAFLLLTHPKPNRVESPIFAGSPLIEQFVITLGGARTPPFDVALARCDPTWRSVLQAPAR